MNNYVKTYKGEFSKERLPLAAKIIYVMTIVTVVLHIISAFSADFADFFNRYISSALRFVLAHLTNYIPFSLAEALLLLLPVFAFLLIRYSIKNHSDSWRSVLIYMGSMLSVVCCFYILFFWSFGVGYNTTPLDRKLGLERNSVRYEELLETAVILTEKVNEAASEVDFREMNFSVMPYGISELSDKLNDSYKKFNETNDILAQLSSNLKPVMLSEAMSYTHITGVYTYFTGEANLNVNFPDYTLPFTAAHEFAHQRGISREDEANFMAFLVCIGSDDPYIRYCGYLNVLEYVLNALYYVAPTIYPTVIQMIGTDVRNELNAYRNFFEKYQNSVISRLSGSINDAYLKFNGTEGEISYGMVVDLAVAYYKEN